MWEAADYADLVLFPQAIYEAQKSGDDSAVDGLEVGRAKNRVLMLTVCQSGDLDSSQLHIIISHHL